MKTSSWWRLAAALIVHATAADAFAQSGLLPRVWPGPDGVGASSGESAIRSVVWYPTPERATAQRVGPFTFSAALDAPVAPGRHPLVLVSHGTGGHELGHAWLGQSLSAAGFVVVALRHAGDNFEDRSAMARTDYFNRRPRQVSDLLTALLNDPVWAARIDATKIAVIGHSAGGYTALALAGGVPDRARVLAHCGPGGIGPREDAAMCALGDRSAPEAGPQEPPPGVTGQSLAHPVNVIPGDASSATAANAVAAGTEPREAQDFRPPRGRRDLRTTREARDPRIRAAVALAPLGVPLDPASLAVLTTPVHIEYGRGDEVLAPHLHAEALCKTLPRATCVASEKAGHLAAFQAGTGPLASAAGDPARDPDGFDRLAWQAQALPRIQAFLNRALR